MAKVELVVVDSAESPVRLGEALCERGQLTAVQLEYAVQKQRVESGKLGQILLRHGLTSELNLALLLAEQMDIGFVAVDKCPTPELALLELFNRELCLMHGFLPLSRADGELHVLLGDGSIERVAELVFQRTGWRCSFVQGEFTKVAQLIRQTYYFASHPVESLIEREVRRLSGDSDHAYGPQQLLEYLLHLAVRERATDIHIAPASDSLHVLFRIDGVLRPMFGLPPQLARLLVFIKLEAEMNISEQRLPQDGSFYTRVLDQAFTLRVSTLVSIHGERMVLRLLPERSEFGGLVELGFLEKDVVVLEQLFARPAGMVLITGPTGSGKSTSLHSALRMQSLIERNVLTVEDPVEYRVPTAGQTEVNRRAGYDFGNALRHFLRHDPDVLLIGEIRDEETARAAVDSASTGHLVLSTLHVSNVFGAVPRLNVLGLDRQTIADNLLAVINQRLLRQNCPFCSTAVAFSAAERRWLAADAPSHGRRGQGCPRCAGTGFYGRLPVYEVLLVSAAVAEGITEGEGRNKLLERVAANSFTDIAQLARWRVAQGQTTMDEVIRTLGGEVQA
ncbi:GspE/PulE family protein [Pseudomonas sp. GWSMS-1]|jgi:type II secretory ATPase GspE/PulE/Tfp pilus assembly ATPase PilB-like protein|uniref:GspE/PulE family protein n=1 Tax=Pseudomonas sp. GWSMS-1 TaxID=3308997 RepID=UPI003CF2C1A8